MAEVTAAAVMKLRKMSGQGMMDCKKALIEANGDIDEAMVILRKKGMVTLQKRSGRETSQGRVLCETASDGKTTAMVMLCCETDFVANSDDFVAAAGVLGEYALACKADEGVDNILETSVDGRKFSDVIMDAISKTGEKIEVGDYVRYSPPVGGVVGKYIHFNNKVGTMVEIETGSEEIASADGLKQIASDIAMHITAIKPLALDRDSIDPETVEREKNVAAEQVKNKPANIIDKIVQGKMNKFFQENCLLEQLFVKDDSKSVAQVLAQAAEQAGGEAKIKRFVRLEIG
jgi:elongation factor Ts